MQHEPGTDLDYTNPEKTRANGRIVHAESMPELKETMRLHHHTILVCWRITEDLIPLLRIVDGVVSESGSDISAEVLADVNKQLVWITNVTDAQKTFENNLSVTVDGEQGLVYEGII